MKKIVIFCLLVLILVFGFISCASGSSSNVSGQNRVDADLLSFMVYGNDFLTSITLPDTWNVDMTVAQQNGVNGFFYLKEYGINNSPAVVILNLAYKPNADTKLGEWIEYDINDFLDYYDGFTSERLNWDVTNKNNYRIITYSLRNDNMGYLQYSAYFDVGLHYFANIYVTVKDKNKHDEIVNDFRKCLENSEFTGIGVIMEQL
jgi:hypothetical protein